MGLAQANLGQSGFALFFALRNAPPLLQVLVGGFAAAASAATALSKAWDESAKGLIRLRVSLAHTDLGDNIEGLQKYARLRQDVTGIDDDATLALANQLVQLNMNARQIETLLPLLQDASAMRPDLGDPATIAKQIHRAMLTNRGQGLFDLGLDANKIMVIRSEAGKFLEIAKELKQKYGGGAALLNPQEINSAAQAWQSLGETLGNIFAPVATGTNAGLKNIAQFYETLNIVARDMLGKIPGFNSLFPTGEMAGERDVNAAAAKNGWRRQRLEEHVKQIAHNTNRMAGALERGFLGGGPNAQGVLGARNINQAIRAVR